MVVSEPLPVCEWLPAVVSRGSSAARSEVTFSSKLRLEADTATEGGGGNLGHQWPVGTAHCSKYYLSAVKRLHSNY